MDFSVLFRKNRAAVRHRLWFAASVKFLVPFSLLLAAGSHLRLQSRSLEQAEPGSISTLVIAASQPFASPHPPVTSPAPAPNWIVILVPGLWACGVAMSLWYWFVRWLQVRNIVRHSTPVKMDCPVRVVRCRERVEPGVFGIFEPVLMLPEGIEARLSPQELQALLIHESSHVERHDNLTAAIHMFVESVFWFHPLVWWIKTRLIEEQERACDEAVLRLGRNPQVYAESILKICEFYLVSPSTCASGMTGSNLRRRIEEGAGGGGGGNRDS